MTKPELDTFNEIFLVFSKERSWLSMGPMAQVVKRKTQQPYTLQDNFLLSTETLRNLQPSVDLIVVEEVLKREVSCSLVAFIGSLFEERHQCN